MYVTNGESAARTFVFLAVVVVFPLCHRLGFDLWNWLGLRWWWFAIGYILYPIIDGIVERIWPTRPIAGPWELPAGILASGYIPGEPELEKTEEENKDS